MVTMDHVSICSSCVLNGVSWMRELALRKCLQCQEAGSERVKVYNSLVLKDMLPMSFCQVRNRY